MPVESDIVQLLSQLKASHVPLVINCKSTVKIQINMPRFAYKNLQVRQAQLADHLLLVLPSVLYFLTVDMACIDLGLARYCVHSWVRLLCTRLSIELDLVCDRWVVLAVHTMAAVA